MAKKTSKKPTLKTIAYMTGLGISTVSKALNDAPDVKKSTRERVRLIAEEIGYVPDRAGQRLRTGKTNVISLVLNTQEEVTNMTNEFIFGITQALKSTTYSLVLSPYTDDDDPMTPIRKVVETHSADGIILSRIEVSDKRVAYLHESGIPYMTHGRSEMGIEHAYFDFDCAAFCFDAVTQLAELGATRIGLLAPSPVYTFGRHMLEGFNRGLLETRLAHVPVASAHLYSSIQSIAEQVSRVLEEKNRPDGFVCGSVSAAFGVVGGIERAGFVVGEDVNIVAKQSPVNLLKWLGQQIYSVEEDFSEAGFCIANSLVTIIAGASIKDHQTVVYRNTLSAS